MSFVNPQLFWILIVPLIAFSVVIVRHNENLSSVFSEEVLKRLSIGDDSLPIVARNLLMIVAIFLMLIALARPVIEHGNRVVELKGISAVVALDISGSMRTKDIYPNRLEFAKKKIVNLLDAMPNDEVSIIAFAHSTFMLAPFSSDIATLKQIVEGVSDKYINMNSTDFTALAHYSRELLEKRNTKVAILFTDGGEKEDIGEFAKIIKKENISLYVVLIGTATGAPVLDKKGKTVQKNGAIVISQRNDALGKVALESGGAFIVADTGTTAIKEMVQKMKAKHQNQKKGEVTIHDREEFFYYPLGLGIFLLLLSFISLPKKIGIKKEKSL